MTGKGISNSEYVERAYLGIMDRASDPDGKADWVSCLDSGMSYTYVLCGFVGSVEFTALCERYGVIRGTLSDTEPRDQNRGVTQFVSRLYNKALDRDFDTAGLNDWCAVINGDTSRENVLYVSLTGFLHSEEFFNKNLSDGDYIKVLYRTFLGREYEQEGYEYWLSKLGSGVSRDEIASGFAYSEEFSNIMAQYGL